jgi:hypothetical protein
MKRFGVALILWCLLAFPLSGYGQEGDIEPMLDVADPQPRTALLDVTPTESESKKAVRVTAVYGVGVDDYLPVKEVARQHLRPKLRRNASRPSFNLPDAFFFIGAPVFILIFLRVLVIFLNGFEEKRKEEMRMSPNNYLSGERVPGD